MRLGAIMHKRVPLKFDVEDDDEEKNKGKKTLADLTSKNTWLQEINFNPGPIPKIIDDSKLNITNGTYGTQRATYFSMSEGGSNIEDALTAFAAMHKASLLAAESHKKHLPPFARYLDTLRRNDIQVRSLVTEEVGSSFISIIERDDFYCYKAVNSLYVEFEQRVQEVFSQNSTLPGCNMKRLFLCANPVSQRLVYHPERLGVHSATATPQQTIHHLAPTNIISD